MKRGLFFPSLLLLGMLTVSACREDETLPGSATAASAGTSNAARGGASSGGGTTPTDSGSSGGAGGGTPDAGSSSGGNGGGSSGTSDGGGTTAATETVTVFHAAGATLYVRRGNEEIWILTLAGNPGAAVGDSFEYRSPGGTFGDRNGILVALSGSGATYRVVAVRRFR